MLPVKFEHLFTKRNYAFSTSDPDRDLTTWYFTDSSGNRGRYRRAHDDGENLVYQGKCSRIFVSPQFLEGVSEAAEMAVQLDKSKKVRKEILSKLEEVFDAVKQGSSDYAGKASFRAQTGWHVFDWRSNPDNAHGSSGLVLLSDRQAMNYFARNSDLCSYSGNCSDWE